MREIDIGLELSPLADLKKLYNIDKILKLLSEDIIKAYENLPKEKGKRSFVYAEIELPEPKDKKGMLGELPTKFLKMVTKAYPYTYKKTEKEFDKYYCGVERGRPEDIIRSLSFVLEHERIHYLHFLRSKCGVVSESVKKDSATREVKLFSERIFTREKPTPPFKTTEEFVPYYEAVAHKIPFEIIEKTNLVVKKTGEGYVRTVRTRANKDIRILKKEDVCKEIVELTKWGAYEFYFETHKCWKETTNCDNCNEFCYPNIVIDIDPGKAISREKLIETLQITQKELSGSKYLIKATGKRGFNIHLFLDGFKLPEPGKYIPLRVMKKRKEMSRKLMKQKIETLAKDPFIVAQDYVRLFAEYLKYEYDLNYLCHDLSKNSGSPDTITLDSSALRKRANTRLPFSLTDKKTVCLIICNEEEIVTKDLIEKFDEISKNPEKVKDMCDELPDFPVKYNDSSFIKDFIEDNERKIAEKQFRECVERLF